MAAAPRGVPEAAWVKLDTPLRREVLAAAGRPAAEVPVLIVLGSGQPSRRAEPVGAGGDRVAVVEAAQAAFDREARPVLDRLAAEGVRDVQPFWINGAIGASLAPSALVAVAGIPEVHRLLLDAPRKAEL
jgi:hypothetical protein